MRLLSLLAVLGLLLAACGDDDTTDDGAAGTTAVDDTGTGDDDGPYRTEDYAAVLATQLRTGGSFPGTEDQIVCVSQGFVEAIGGADALNEAGTSPEDLARAQGPDDLGVELDEEAVADELVTRFDDCDYDLIRLLTESLGPDAPAGFEDCVRAQISNDDVARVFARLIIDPTDQAAPAAIVPQLEACATTTTTEG